MKDNDKQRKLQEEPAGEGSQKENKVMTAAECLALINDLKTELDQEKKEKEQFVSHLQRLQADFENFRRRVRREKEEMSSFASAELIKNLLPILDNFDRALEAGNEQFGDTTFYEGVNMIYKGLLEVLKKEGVERIESVGCTFDPEKHEAVMQVETSEEHPDNTVVEELQKGYTMNKKVLRPSMVKVAKDS